MLINKDSCVAIIGIGYVGLPLALACSKKMSTIGYDIHAPRVLALQNGHDVTNQCTAEELGSIQLTDQAADLAAANIFVITVPTPILDDQSPDLSHLIAACQTITPFIQKNTLVIIESTVYPGVTGTTCRDILEHSGLKAGEEFFLAYSPERINPSDKDHTIQTVDKIVAGDCSQALEAALTFYHTILPNIQLHPAHSLETAELCKLIENTQRDLNIAFMNEMKQLCDRLELPIEHVLSLCQSKWNFLNFEPGLVGGHCISIDPYYLMHLGESLQLPLPLIQTARQVNEDMVNYCCQDILKQFSKSPQNGQLLILGATFKEDCPDTRNSKVFDLANALSQTGCQVHIYDPYIETLPEAVNAALVDGQTLNNTYDGIVLAVKHQAFMSDGNKIWESHLASDGFFYAIKSRSL